MMLVDDDGLTRVDQVGFSARQVRSYSRAQEGAH